RFRMATRYARNSFLIPEVKAHYEAVARMKRNTTPFGVAVGDFLSPVAITSVITRDYRGQVADSIAITVNDVFKVKMMKVIITDANGGILEDGDATRVGNGSCFEYSCKCSIPDVEEVTITVRVTDWPGNVVIEEVTNDKGLVT
ncbi:MAG TPA: hypothetical protein VGD31_13400, partial [Sphingobacteriaceae bacterium]